MAPSCLRPRDDSRSISDVGLSYEAAVEAAVESDNANVKLYSPKRVGPRLNTRAGPASNSLDLHRFFPYTRRDGAQGSVIAVAQL